MAVLCLGLAIGALWILSRLDGWKNANRPPRATVNYLLEGDLIVDATPIAEGILTDVGPTNGHDWSLLHRAFSARFPGLPATAAEARDLGPIQIDAAISGDRASLRLGVVNGKLRVGLEEPDSATAADRHLRIRQLDQLNKISEIAEMFPYPIWLQSQKGMIDWANRAYLQLLKRVSPIAEGALIQEFDLTLPNGQTSHTQRTMVVDQKTSEPKWFNASKLATPDGGTMGLAIDIDAVIEAETAQRKFVQTLTKTFAQLSTGLAIFDRERQLALFNPALIDLLALPAEFLSTRPTLLTFFDMLRDNRMMPEPKDYANWRQQITDMVIASVDGRFQEIWTLPSGLTYRVTGRPHPDGAIALLFEDISAEISLTRRFRAQLNLGQAAIDTLDEAIAVFSTSGTLTMSNLAFRKLWKMDPDSSFADVTIRDAMTQWRKMAKPGPFWPQLQEYFNDPNDRADWFSDVTMTNGTALECRVAPLSGGATLVGFRLRPVFETAPQTAGKEGA
ncbi:PAS-domain containing protein [Alisedimentitalea sp. MJ-SS2]|nr:PAS-domain containing protein [Alisedimentitalea sp. MJ-SS2]